MYRHLSDQDIWVQGFQISHQRGPDLDSIAQEFLVAHELLNADGNALQLKDGMKRRRATLFETGFKVIADRGNTFSALGQCAAPQVWPPIYQIFIAEGGAQMLNTVGEIMMNGHVDLPRLGLGAQIDLRTRI